jgi:serine/threonine-protein phosphatase 6 regulatory ankyrin repeat subunit B
MATQAADAEAALVSAVLAANLEAVKILVATGDVNSAGRDGLTPLIRAAGVGLTGVVEYLLGTPGIDIDARSADGLRAIDHACRGGHLEIVKLLVKGGVRIDHQASNECSGPLISAAMVGNLECSSLFKVKAIPNLGREPLRETIRTVPTKS